jgi:signal transduction histidine kinase
MQGCRDPAPTLIRDSMPKFTVDTHLFRELGALLVGRDSTALVELVKNSYDADATSVTVIGEGLTTTDGRVVVSDDGIGMSRSEFETGFLRVASRVKEQGERRSAKFHRRYTGAKGIGRLAAHKLARVIDIVSHPDPSVPHAGEVAGVHGVIDWDEVEQHETLDDVGRGVRLERQSSGRTNQHGTALSLMGLRRPWTENQLERFVAEVRTFEAPDVFTAELRETIAPSAVLFDRPEVRDTSGDDPGFTIHLEGDFEVGDAYWLDLAERTQWILEIRAAKGRREVEYALSPTQSHRKQHSLAARQVWRRAHPHPKDGPWFAARIFINDTGRVRTSLAAFARESSGVRVYMEGFRVLPYGERGDDWLKLDADYTRRREPFQLQGVVGEEATGETFFRLANRNYFGAVFLTERGAPTLQMLVNREGFIPDSSWQTLTDLVRTGIDLSVRARAALAAAEKEEATQQQEGRPQPAREAEPSTPTSRLSTSLKSALETVQGASGTLGDLDVSEPHTKELAQDLGEAVLALGRAATEMEALRSEQSEYRVAASIGTQLAAFVHELNGVLAQARAARELAQQAARAARRSPQLQEILRELHTAVEELVQSLSRQAAFLTDFVGVDARRRRRRLDVSERLTVVEQLLLARFAAADIQLEREIPPGTRTPPMFGAELTVILLNLLTNAIKAASSGGRVRVEGSERDAGGLRLRVENTGERVPVTDSERWFRPFESTTAEVDEVLGQGMGLGLPIVRRTVEEYGGTARFVRPGRGMATAVEVEIPEPGTTSGH